MSDSLVTRYDVSVDLQELGIRSIFQNKGGCFSIVDPNVLMSNGFKATFLMLFQYLWTQEHEKKILDFKLHWKFQLMIWAGKIWLYEGFFFNQNVTCAISFSVTSVRMVTQRNCQGKWMSFFSRYFFLSLSTIKTHWPMLSYVKPLSQ